MVGVEVEKNVSATVEQLNEEMKMSVMPVTVFIGLETVVGFVGNILILTVYSQRYERSNFRYFVLSMAVIDLTSCVTTLPGEILSQMNWYTYEYALICKIKSYFNVFTAWGSASILLLLGFDRYRKICQPLRWQLRPSVAKKLCGMSFLMSAIVAAPILFLWGTQSYSYEYQNVFVNVSICEKAEEFADEIYPLLYIGLVYVLPLGLMICIVSSLNTLTARALFGRKRHLLKYRSTYKTTASQETMSSTVLQTGISNTGSICMEHTPGPNVSVVSDGTLNTSNSQRKIIDMEFEADEEFISADNLPQQVNGISEPLNVLTRVSYRLIKRIQQEQTNCSTNKNINQTDNDKRLAQTSKPINKEETGSRNPQHVYKNRGRRNEAVRQKTIIMLVLTIMFVVTMAMYVILTCFVAGTEGVLKNLSNSEKTIFFFFWRLYFVNTNINPILYGFMDPRFRAGLLSFVK